MNEIIGFNYGTAQIRTSTDNGEPIFCGTDIASALGFKRPNDALKQHCGGAVIHRSIIDSLGRVQNARFINEADTFRLIMKATTAGAEAFQDWVCSEVLPEIRKKGSYSVYQDQIPKSLPEALIAYAGALQENEALQLQAEQDAPKVAFTDSIKTSKDTILMRELAKLINQSHKIKIGQNKLFCWMRSNGYLIRAKGTDYNMPTQKAMDLGVLVIKEGSRSNGEESHITKTAKVTGKGQVYFINKFKPCTDLVSA